MSAFRTVQVDGQDYIHYEDYKAEVKRLKGLTAVPHPGCSYLGFIGEICNKCGQKVDPVLEAMLRPPSIEGAWREAAEFALRRFGNLSSNHNIGVWVENTVANLMALARLKANRAASAAIDIDGSGPPAGATDIKVYPQVPEMTECIDEIHKDMQAQGKRRAAFADGSTWHCGQCQGLRGHRKGCTSDLPDPIFVKD